MYLDLSDSKNGATRNLAGCNWNSIFYTEHKNSGFYLFAERHKHIWFIASFAPRLRQGECASLRESPDSSLPRHSTVPAANTVHALAGVATESRPLRLSALRLRQGECACTSPCTTPPCPFFYTSYVHWLSSFKYYCVTRHLSLCISNTVPLGLRSVCLIYWRAGFTVNCHTHGSLLWISARRFSVSSCSAFSLWQDEWT